MRRRYTIKRTLQQDGSQVEGEGKEGREGSPGMRECGPGWWDWGVRARWRYVKEYEEDRRVDLCDRDR